MGAALKSRRAGGESGEESMSGFLFGMVWAICGAIAYELIRVGHWFAGVVLVVILLGATKIGNKA